MNSVIELACRRLPRSWGPQRADGADGIPIVLLHAFPFDATMWDEVAAALAPVAPVLLVDAPGAGGSGLPAGEPSLESAAAGVVAALDRFGCRRAVVAGVSMGGYLALALARLFPQRLAGLVLIDTKAEADPEPARAHRLRVAEAVTGAAGTRALLPMLDSLLAPQTLRERPELVARVRQWLLAADPAGVAWAQRAMAARPDSTDVLARVAVPAAVVVGEQDGLTGPDRARDLARRLPDAVLTVLPGVGHLSPVEAPREVAAAITGVVLRTR